MGLPGSTCQPAGPAARQRQHEWGRALGEAVSFAREGADAAGSGSGDSSAEARNQQLTASPSGRHDAAPVAPATPAGLPPALAGQAGRPSPRAAPSITMTDGFGPPVALPASSAARSSFIGAVRFADSSFRPKSAMKVSADRDGSVVDRESRLRVRMAALEPGLDTQGADSSAAPSASPSSAPSAAALDADASVRGGSASGPSTTSGKSEMEVSGGGGAKLWQPLGGGFEAGGACTHWLKGVLAGRSAFAMQVHACSQQFVCVYAFLRCTTV